MQYKGHIFSVSVGSSLVAIDPIPNLPANIRSEIQAKLEAAGFRVVELHSEEFHKDQEDIASSPTYVDEDSGERISIGVFFSDRHVNLLNRVADLFH